MGVSSNGKYLPLDDFQGREAYLAAAVDGALAEDCGENFPWFFDPYCAK